MNSEKRQTAIRSVAERLQAEAHRLFEILAKAEDTQGGNFSFSTPIGDSHATTMSGLFARIEAASELMLAIADSEQVPVTPHVWWANLTDQASQAVNHLSQANSWAEQWSPSEGLSVEVPNLVLRSPSGQSTDLGGPIRTVDQHIDTILDHGFRLQWSVARTEPAQSSHFVAKQELYINELASTISVVQQLSREAANIHDSLKKRMEDTQVLLLETEEARKQSVADATTIAEHRKRISDILDDIDNNIRVRAEALDQRVTDYQPKFAEFDRALAERTQSMIDGQDQLRLLLEANKELKKEAGDLITNAREALKWATAQGLAQGFSLEAQSLDKPIENAIWAVYASLGIFAVWAFVLFVVPHALGLPLPSFMTFDPNHVGTSIAQGFLGLVTRLALLFPAIYLVIFCNKRYRELFVVREQYTFKKAIATAVPGFKEQAAPANADEHVRAMTAAAFERLLFNPREAATRDLSGEARGGPLSRWLVRIVARAIDETRKLGERPPPK
jgi:predicted  nucleic acid-binding Zn-ribbon protein